jgi:transcription elongation factor Elf1
MGDGTMITCPTCGAQFAVEEMAPRDPSEEQNTQVDWLVAGRCPKCSNTVQLSISQLQEIARKLDEAD